MKIPFNFDAIPKYFRIHGWLDPKKNGSHFKMAYFLLWCFSRCSYKPRIVFHDHKEILLEPFEFVFGRNACSKETGLTEQEIRTMINQLNRTSFGEILKKSTNSVTNRFTCYKWSTDVFLETANQQSNQPLTNRQPTDQPQARKQEAKNLEVIEKDALSAFTEKAEKKVSLPALCLPPISEEITEREIQSMFFIERAKGLGWQLPEESITLWIKTYDIHYLIQTLDLVVKRKNVEEPVRLFAAAVRDDYVGEKVRKKENKIWIEALKSKYGWPWIKITKAYCTIMTGSHESYYYERVNFRMEITRKLELYGEKTA